MAAGAVGSAAIVATARETYAVLSEQGMTYRAFGAARDCEGDYIAAFVSWVEDGHAGPPLSHSETLAIIHTERMAEVRNPPRSHKARRSHYFTPDGVPRMRPAPIGKGGQRVSGFRPTGAIQDKGRFAPVNRRDVRWADSAKSMTPLPDGDRRAPVYYSEEGARKATRRMVDEIARYKRGDAEGLTAYRPTTSTPTTMPANDPRSDEERIAAILEAQRVHLLAVETRSAIMRQNAA